MFIERFEKELKLQRKAGLYRSPPSLERRDGAYVTMGGMRLLSFASNDYLGLGQSGELAVRVADNFSKYGSSSGSSRLVAGNYDVISQAEKACAEYFGYEDALFFPSGFQANIGLISGLFKSGDHIIADKRVHASMVKGIQLSRASFSGFRHNSMPHLKSRLLNSDISRTAVVTESLFSMDGDILYLKEFGRLKKEKGFFSIVDEAHAFGVLGEKGRGLAREVADIAVGTFGKALGLFGAFVLLPASIKPYLYNFSHPLIYTTTLPEAHAASVMDILSFIESADRERDNLKKLSSMMKSGLRSYGFTVTGDAHIVSIHIGNEDKLMRIYRKLMEKGMMTLPARCPTVPAGQALLRLSITALHTENNINAFIDSMKFVSTGGEYGD